LTPHPSAPDLPRDVALHALSVRPGGSVDRSAVHAWMRATLAAHCGDDPSALAFAEGPAGKPCLVDPLGAPLRASYNLSHSGHLAVLVVSALGRPVGVDVEIPRPGRDLRRLVEGFLSPGEVSQLDLVPAAAAQSWLLRRWTAKEALAKAWGLGLSAGLPRIAFDEGPPARFEACAGLRPPDGSWSLAELDVPGGVGWVAWGDEPAT